nr:MAG TPA: hypothetical protein [Bacteriophage sp.]
MINLIHIHRIGILWHLQRLIRLKISQRFHTVYLNQVILHRSKLNLWAISMIQRMIILVLQTR